MKGLPLRLPALLVLLIPMAASALSFPLPPEGDDLVGEVREVHSRYEDTLSDIARNNDLGYTEITEANREVDPWLPGEGTQVLLPTHFILPSGSREGIVINLAELRLYYFPKGGKEVITHPLGIGREGWSTPIGKARVTGKRHKPSWRPTPSILKEHEEMGDPLPALVKPGPDNPLGEHAIYLSMRGYLLHGTNKPYGVGMRVSHGCIRLYPEDIATLFDQVPTNTPVRIVNEPYKAGWLAGRLYIEAHPPLSEQRKARGINFTPMVSAIVRAMGEHDLKPDWEAMREAAIDQRGIPVPVTPTDAVESVTLQSQ